MLTSQPISSSVLSSNHNPVTVYLNSGTWGLFTDSDDPSGKTLGIAVLDVNSYVTSQSTIYEVADELEEFDVFYEKDITLDTSSVGSFSDTINIISGIDVDETVSVSGLVQYKNIQLSDFLINLGSIGKGSVEYYESLISIENTTEPIVDTVTISDIVFPSGVKARWNDIGGAYSQILSGRTIDSSDLSIDLEITASLEGIKKNTIEIDFS